MSLMESYFSISGLTGNVIAADLNYNILGEWVVGGGSAPVMMDWMEKGGQ